VIAPAVATDENLIIVELLTSAQRRTVSSAPAARCFR
jgi:hypothetical protein